ncbi:MAG: thiamine phosphate synthase [Betaproteobacteria bacterium]|nr:thiamine phosphate synthase [Betaproteobacteria bacterium]
MTKTDTVPAKPTATPTRNEIAGLYVVTPDESNTVHLEAKVRAALAGGARLVQYRNKSASGALRREQAMALLTICRMYGVPLIINDHLELALETGADGVHLGVDDGSIAAARERLGTGKILGASCYGRLQNALQAQQSGASYVAFGSFFASGVKPDTVRAPLRLLHEAKQALSIPVVAIGGITLANATQLVAAGADSLAVISAVFSAHDVRAAARRFSALFG